jgi:hypothetical protein
MSIMNIQPISNNFRKDSDVVIVYNNDLKKAIKALKIKSGNYRTGTILKFRRDHPAPGDHEK